MFMTTASMRSRENDPKMQMKKNTRTKNNERHRTTKFSARFVDYITKKLIKTEKPMEAVNTNARGAVHV